MQFAEMALISHWTTHVRIIPRSVQKLFVMIVALGQKTGGCTVGVSPRWVKIRELTHCCRGKDNFCWSVWYMTQTPKVYKNNLNSSGDDAVLPKNIRPEIPISTPPGHWRIYIITNSRISCAQIAMLDNTGLLCKTDRTSLLALNNWRAGFEQSKTPLRLILSRLGFKILK